MMNVGTVLLLLAAVQGIRAGCVKNVGQQLILKDRPKGRLIKFYGFNLYNAADASVSTPALKATVNGKLCVNVPTATTGDKNYACGTAMIGREMIIVNAVAGQPIAYCKAQASGVIWCGANKSYDSATDSCVTCKYGDNGHGGCKDKPSAPAPPKAPTKPAPPRIPTGPRLNIALKKRTWQSKEAWWGASGRANDGNHNPRYLGRSCSHTAKVNNPFWAVDLGQQYLVTGVSITNRIDWLFSKVLRNFVVVVTNNKPHAGLTYDRKEICTFKQHSFSRGQVTWDSKCYQPIKGRYVMVKMKDKSRLVMCEVDVWNVQLPGSWPTGDRI